MANAPPFDEFTNRMNVHGRLGDETLPRIEYNPVPDKLSEMEKRIGEAVTKVFGFQRTRAVLVGLAGDFENPKPKISGAVVSIYYRFWWRWHFRRAKPAMLAAAQQVLRELFDKEIPVNIVPLPWHLYHLTKRGADHARDCDCARGT